MSQTGGKKAKKTSGMTLSQLHSALAEDAGITKTQVKAVFDSLEKHVQKALKSSHGQITVMRGLKLKKKHVKARKARKGVNPFTGEPMTFKAKPASKTVRASVLKHMKDLVN